MASGTDAAPEATAGGPKRGGAIRALTFTTLYPNAAQPYHGIFVETRLRHLVASGAVTSQVLAPVPWFPSLGRRALRRYAHYAQVPAQETRRGLAIAHPRYPVIPKLGMSIAPFTLFLAAWRALRGHRDEFDLIDAHYFYPDGVAAVMLGQVLRKPVVITARGTDINLIPRHAVPRRLILWAARRAAGIITVSEALRREAIALGIEPHRVRTLRNGVDLTLFRPLDRAALRTELGVTGRVLLSVGHLIERKGHDLIIAALPRLPGTTLLIAGDGPERAALVAQATRLGVAERVRFLGGVAQAELARLYSAADALVLASSREGWANVLLEAMACGTPVVASNIWGNPEIVSHPAAGVLMPERSATGVAAGVEALFAAPPDRAATRAFAEAYGWDETTAGQIALFGEVLRGEPARHGAILPSWNETGVS